MEKIELCECFPLRSLVTTSSKDENEMYPTSLRRCIVQPKNTTVSESMTSIPRGSAYFNPNFFMHVHIH